MIDPIQSLFGNVIAQLEDLHAIAIEGQCADNTPELQTAINVHLRSGLAAIDGTIRTMATGLEGSRS